MSYQIVTSKIFEKDFEKLDSIMQSRVLVALEQMQKNPFTDIKKLHNVKTGIFRRRIGDYRLRFDLVKKEIHLHQIKNRREVYKN